ncbi:aldolase/citrate lyase family protein [Hansschlegelia zhihuaiae]|uniref:aldolase/citrate lyase family protein n=1 Tax=Hansschlegelia zhihuaiae TaxID=405005 RepID=UPI0013E8F208|nr:aldolase/citrate lyase family protein [Hansschlegelia zhihuaiae]
MVNPLQSLLLVAAGDDDGLDAGLAAGADSLVIDPRGPGSDRDRRRAAADALARIGGAIPTFVRVGLLDSDAAEADLSALAPLAPTGVLLPRTEESADLEHLGALLAVAEAKAGLEDGATRIIALVETGAALFGLIGFARASRRLAAIAWDGEALAHDLGGEAPREPDGRWTDPCQTARTLVLAAAADARLPAIDSPFSGASVEAFRREAETARRDGFAGKLALDARQAAIVAQVFSRRRGSGAGWPAGAS